MQKLLTPRKMRPDAIRSSLAVSFTFKYIVFWSEKGECAPAEVQVYSNTKRSMRDCRNQDKNSPALISGYLKDTYVPFEWYSAGLNASERPVSKFPPSTNLLSSRRGKINHLQARRCRRKLYIYILEGVKR